MTICTEKEAAEKWCPLGRVVSGRRVKSGELDMFPGSSPANILAVGEAHADLIPLGRCIGSRCMAWRWQVKFISEIGADGRHLTIGKEQGDAGYCGAFGRAEP